MWIKTYNQQQQNNENCSNALTGHRPPPRTPSRSPRCLIVAQLHTYIWKEQSKVNKCKLQNVILIQTNRRFKCTFSPRIHLQPGLQLTRLGGIRSLQNFPGFRLNHFDRQITHLAALIHGLQDIMNVKLIMRSSLTIKCLLLLHTSHLYASEFTFILILFVSKNTLMTAVDWRSDKKHKGLHKFSYCIINYVEMKRYTQQDGSSPLHQAQWHWCLHHLPQLSRYHQK